MKQLSVYRQSNAVVGIADRQYLNRAQATPWCRSATGQPAPALEPGRALLISVGDGRRSLWSFHRQDARTAATLLAGSHDGKDYILGHQPCIAMPGSGAALHDLARALN